MTPIAIHKATAIGFFRSSVFFIFAAAAFAERYQHTSTLLVTGVFLLDVVSWHLSQVITIIATESYNRSWLNTLSDRFILEKLLDRVRAGSQIDFEEVVKESTSAAGKDIQKFVRENASWAEWGWFRKSAAGFGYFVWFWVSYGILYGIAAIAGSFLKGGG
jgi:hypothetical protein